MYLYVVWRFQEITNLLHFLDKSSEGDEEDGVRNPFSRGPDDIGSITGSQNSRRHLLDHGLCGLCCPIVFLFCLVHPIAYMISMEGR